jgi:hypothetical protein
MVVVKAEHQVDGIQCHLGERLLKVTKLAKINVLTI